MMKPSTKEGGGGFVWPFLLKAQLHEMFITYSWSKQGIFVQHAFYTHTNIKLGSLKVLCNLFRYKLVDKY
jgi:hypothetical protein